MLEAVGYWFNDRAPSGYPRPQKLVATWEPVQRKAVVAYLRAGLTLETYRGKSHCRFACGEQDMGHRDYTDGVFAWPEGLPHYVEKHAVRLPDHFVAHALSGTPPVEPKVKRIDDRPWLRWGVAQDATVELTGWDALGWEDQKKVLERLHARIAPGHPLHQKELEVLVGRRSTDELLVLLPDGTMAVVRLSDASTRLFASWDEWLPRSLPTGC
ncbi:MAG: hypothetical protein H0T46_19315 [Deltaproteobacteria bacterium]|nr:hypothetical protein [Deltaproteobacteria bacterium]